MKTVIKIIFCFFICTSCQRKEGEKKRPENIKLNDVKRSYRTEVENEMKKNIVGNYIPDEGCCNCKFDLTFSEKNDKLFYSLKTDRRSVEGIAEISFEDDIVYIILPIEWDDYQGDTTFESYEPNKEEKPRGVSLNFDPEDKTIIFQNYGDAMNSYIIFDECDNKAIMLVNNKAADNSKHN